MGAWLGLRAQPGESMNAYKDRLFATLNARETSH